ncbi:MAG: hypothetical protein ABWK00_01445 [Desulfurococcaceae archaeon]
MSADGALQRVEEVARDLEELRRAVEELGARVARLGELVEQLAKEVGKVADSFGFIIEDVARGMLPYWLEARKGIKVESLGRRFLEVDGRSLEVDLFGEGRSANGARVLVVGEVKVRVHAEDVRRLGEKARVVGQAMGVDVVPVVYGLYVHPQALSEAQASGIAVVSPYPIGVGPLRAS